jgi:hypothetical protein
VSGPARSGTRQYNTRQYVVVLMAIVAGSALAWWAASGPWVVVEESLLGDAQGSLAQAVSQQTLGASALAPAAAAMPIVGFAGVAGIIGSRGIIRRLVGLLVVLAGLVLASSGAQAALSLQVGDVVSVGEIVSVGVVYPLTAAVAGLVLTAGGVAVVFRGHLWPHLGANYERSTNRPRDAWEAMDQGVDPTTD